MNAMRTHVRMVQPRFVPKILDGSKFTTIRPTPKRDIQVGDLIDLRAWTGLPYRSLQRKLALGVCIETKSVAIRVTRRCIFISLGSDLPFFKEQADEFAQRDGFSNAGEMVEWFEEEHGLPFKGIWIRWSLLAKATTS